MTKTAKTNLITLGIIGFVALLLYILFIYPYPIYRAYTVGCESLYRSEVKKVREALAGRMSDHDLVPTLNELIALGLYTLPQDRKFKSNYPRGTRDLRVKLIIIDDRFIKKDWKIFVTSTGKRCVKGEILVVQGFDDKGEWVEEWPDE